jgi:hypothetical protein
MVEVARGDSEPYLDDVAEVLCAVSARLDTLVRRRLAARHPCAALEDSGRGLAQAAQAAHARQIPRAVSLTNMPWAAKGSLKYFDPRAGAHSEASSTLSTPVPVFSAPRDAICRASSADAASRTSTALQSSSAEDSLASRRRVKAPTKLCLMTGAKSASDQASTRPSRGALRSRGCPSDDALEGSERSARQAPSSASAAAALVSSVLSLLAVLLYAASSIFAPFCSSRPPWWPQSCESPQRPTRQGEGRAPVSPWSGLDSLFVDWMDVNFY